MRIIWILIPLVLLACVHTNQQQVQVNYGERQTLYFTGRGAAAGIMMDSLLGGTGVAIGVAIDEGISKDIAAAISIGNPSFSMDRLVKDGLGEAVSQGVNIKGLESVIIDRYGFQAAPDDKVVPLLELRLVCKSGPIRKVNFAPNEIDLAIPFAKAKTDGSLAESKLRDAVDALFATHGSSLCHSS